MSSLQGTARPKGWFQRIDALTLRALLLRSAILWLVARLAFTLLSAGSGGGMMLAPAVVPLFAAAVGGLAIVDVRALREDVFLANLGVGARHVFSAAFGVALVVELVILTAVTALRP